MLRRYFRKQKQGEEKTIGYIKTCQVFTDKQEEKLEKYIIRISKL